MTHFKSTGSHEYDLRSQPERTHIATAEGTATLRRPLQSAESIGAGNLCVLNGVTNSHINLHGSLEVHRDIENTEVLIGGDPEAHGNVTLGEQGLHCRNARIRSGLTAASPVECETLDVVGPLHATDSRRLSKLRCRGPLTAERIEITTDTAITSNTRPS